MEGPYLQELKNRRAGLKFTNARVETEYQVHEAGRHGADLRLQLFLATLMIGTVCVLDYLFFDPEYSRLAITLRLGVMLPPIVVMFAMSQLINARKHLQAAGVVTGLAVGLTSLAIGVVAARQGVPQVYHGYEIVTVFVYFFLGLRVANATMTGMILFLSFMLVAVVNNADLVTATFQCVFLLFLNIMGAVGNYQLSKSRRSLFLEERVLNYRANHDALTRLPNRRAFDTLLASAWDNSRAQLKPVCLLMMDIDHFKNYNDLYGHQAGDKAIREVGAILGKSLQRPQDFAGRYGGEEFVILLFDTTKEYAIQLADRIREQLLRKNIEHRGSSVAPCVSISIGLAHLDPNQSRRSMKGFLQMADEALYAAKELGRNCVVDADRTSHVTSTGMFHVSRLDQSGGINAALAAAGKT